MGYSVRKAKWEDIPRIEALYGFARGFMAAHGNAKQWGDNYPPAEMIREDIGQGKLYLVHSTEEIHGVFYFCAEEDPTYRKIYQGEWQRDDAYGVIHRVAGDGSGGIFQTVVDYAREKIGYLRIDTHEDNLVMQRALEKQRFRRCGVVIIEDGTTRLAYDRIEE